jgi:hypothetical protein
MMLASKNMDAYLWAPAICERSGVVRRKILVGACSTLLLVVASVSATAAVARDSWLPSKKYVYQYVARPVTGGINGADYVPLGSAPAASYCDPMSPGAKFSKTSSTARTFSTGVELSYVIGIDLSSRTGFTASQSLTSKNTGSASKQLCGVDGRYADTPGLVRVK